MATIHDVARHAEVSTATVSRVLNGKVSVDPALVERVHAAIRELDYRPNGVARNLRRQATAVWALIIADIENPFFTAVARGVEDAASAAGYSVVLCNSDENVAKENRYILVAAEERVAGVILSPTLANSNISRLSTLGIPVVVVDRPLAGASTDAVVVGSRRGAADATSHLLDQGYERVACITGPSSVSTAEDRLAGYLDTLRDRGLLQQRLVEQANFKVGGGRAAADRLLSMPDPPDGLFVANSLMAIGALEALRDRGLRAGRDVGIVAFDDAPWGEVIDPPMTVIAQPAYDIGRASGELLRERISGAIRRPRTFTLTTELIVRDSSRR